MDEDENARQRHAYSGGSQMASAFPSDDDKPAEDQHQDHEPADDPDPDHSADNGGDEDGGDEGQGQRPGRSPGGGFSGAGAGWVLGMLAWGWVVLPFVKAGPAGVAHTLRAKFLNQAPDGSPLP